MKRRISLIFVILVIVFLAFVAFQQFQKPNMEEVTFPLKKDGITVVRVEPGPGEAVGRKHHITIWVEPADPSIIRANIIVTPEPEYIMKRVPAYVPERYLGFRWEVTAENGSYKVKAKVINRETGDLLEISWGYVVGSGKS